MVAEIVGSWQGELCREGGPGDELRHGFGG